MNDAPRELTSRLSDPVSRAVLSDWLTEQGRERSLQATIAALEISAIFGATATATAAATADDDVADDAGDDEAATAADDVADDAADDEADDDDADDDDVAAYAADDDDALKNNQMLWMKGPNEMRDGLAIVVVAGGWRALTRVGWLRRVEGDEWELVGARSVRTVGRYVPLAELATIGPVKDVSLQQEAAEPEPIHRLLMRRVLYCDVAKWAKEVPRPKGWET